MKETGRKLIDIKEKRIWVLSIKAAASDKN